MLTYNEEKKRLNDEDITYADSNSHRPTLLMKLSVLSEFVH